MTTTTRAAWAIAIASLALTAHSPAADSIHACVKPNGKPRIVADPSACTRSESPLSWPSATGTSALVVIDGRGRNVGPVVHVEDPPFDPDGRYLRRGAPLAVDAAYRIGERIFLLRFLSIEPYLDGTSRVFFESCDCSGEPLIRAEPSGNFDRLFTPSAIGGFHVLYLARSRDAEGRWQTLCSFLTADTGCEAVSGEEPAEHFVVPAERIGELPFVEPYHVGSESLRSPDAE